MSKKQGLKAAYSGQLRFHWRWNVYLAFTLFILDAVLLWQNRKSGLIALAFTAVYLAAVIIISRFYQPRIMHDLISFATHYGQIQRTMMQEFAIPAALLEPDGRVLWMNDQMQYLTGRSGSFHKDISTLFPQIGRGALPVSVSSKSIKVEHGGKDFRCHIQKLHIEDLFDQSEMIENTGRDDCLYMAYLFDETELNRVVTLNREQKSVVGLVYIDNYEEVIERTDEVHQSLLNVLVERRINKYFAESDALVKKLEKDKYLVVLSNKSLEQLKEDRFSLLEGVKSIRIGNEISMTVSGGFGLNGSGYSENYEGARGAIEMALGRGGDQFVIKDGSELSFFGGKTMRSEKSTRVKARVKAQALRELILSRDRVITMGHALTDMDSLGACIGVYRAAATLGKSAHIVIGELNTNIREWVSAFTKSGDYPDDLFIDHEQAREMTDRNTALIIADTNRANMVECRELLSLAETIVVIDHHRQTADTIENAALSYIEPSASSACEMIAEILQYLEETVRLKNREADCIYAGIVIDTQSFVAKTGVRTFEAAAYLRRCGADVTRVRKALRDNLNSYMAKAEAVREAQTFMDCYAISVLKGSDLDDPNVVGAQAANDLLNIVGVRASFVLTPYDDRIFISARSIDELNVQLVMERLGGGGHLSIAGAQLKGVTVDEAVERLKGVLREMTEEGAI